MGYPETFMRQNCYASHYAEIAIKNYYEMKEVFEQNNGKDIKGEIVSEIRKVVNMQMICCVFSEMALESFFNDYAAACLGDSEFYDEFDKLSVIGKFQLIVNFILKKDFDKSKAYYSSLKKLLKDRNDLVHNKSTSIKPEDIQKCERCLNGESLDFDYEEYLKSNVLIIKDALREAKEYINAMVRIAKFFHENDVNARPFIRLFVGVCNYPKYELAKKFSKEFGFKWGNNILGLHD